jgi:hypothetical protein
MDFIGTGFGVFFRLGWTPKKYADIGNPSQTDSDSSLRIKKSGRRSLRK